MIPTCKLTLQQGAKIPNFSHRDGANEIILIYGGIYANILQYISEEGRVQAICVAYHKNEGAKGKAKAAAAFGFSTHVRRELSSRISQEKAPETKKQLAKFQLQAVQTNCRRFLAFVCSGEGSSLQALACIDKGCTLKENPRQAVFIVCTYGNTHLSIRPKKARYPAIWQGMS